MLYQYMNLLNVHDHYGSLHGLYHRPQSLESSLLIQGSAQQPSDTTLLLQVGSQ